MKIYDKENLDLIVNELKNHKTLVTATDTVPGLISINDTDIYKIKKRSLDKKIVLFISDFNMIPNVSEAIKKIAKTFWPGSLTIVWQKQAYRIPNDIFLIQLINRIGPLYCSSANVSGKGIIKNFSEAICAFEDNKSNLIFVNKKFFFNNPSTIYSLDDNKILREGDISYEQIRKCLEN